MGWEKFLQPKKVEQETEEVEEIDESKRSFVIGGTALVVGSMLGVGKVEAKGKKILSIRTPEGREQNIKNLRIYQEWVTRDEHVAALRNENSTRKELDRIIFLNGHLPATVRKYLEGTEFDHTNLYTESGSFPAIQLRREKNMLGELEINFRFADTLSDDENVELISYGQCFVLDGDNLITNKHVANAVFGDALSYDVLEGDEFDIAGLKLSELGSEMLIENASRVSMSSNGIDADRNLQGEIVDGVGLHETRGSGADDIDVMTGVLIKLTPVIIREYFPDWFYDDTPSGKSFLKQLLNSYMKIVPSREVNGDHVADNLDVHGMSSGPMFAHSDTSKGRLTPCGHVWGSWMIDNQSEGTSHTIVFSYGPDILTKMNNKLNARA